MMCEQLRCEIVQDLLPSYVDGLTSEVTTQAVNDHLASCKSCRQICERMKTDGDNLTDNEYFDHGNIPQPGIVVKAGMSVDLGF